MNNPIFLISTGRTGTKFFSDFFSSYGIDVASYHTSSFTRVLNVLGNMYWRKLFSRSVMKFLWKRLKFKRIKSHGSRYIECNPYYYNMIDIILDFFPGAKFIFIVRSPKAFIVSHIKWERQRLKSMVANRLVPFWQPTSYLDQVKGFTNDYYQRVEFYSKIWARKNTAIMGAVSGKDNVITLFFEQLFHPETGVKVMSGLVRWLDVPLNKPISQDMITAKKNISKGVQTESWDDNCTRIMNSYCQPLVKKLGEGFIAD